MGKDAEGEIREEANMGEGNEHEGGKVRQWRGKGEGEERRAACD